MGGGINEMDRKQKYSYYAADSPLKQSETRIKASSKTEKSATENSQEREKNFILDGVYERVHKSSVLPSYDAAEDPHAVTYFRQPAVQVMMTKSADCNNKLIPPALPPHKLSTRKRVPNTPSKMNLEQRESSFVIDSVRADSMKSRNKPIIPQYDALNDAHAKKYFKKRAVRFLLKRTCNLEIK